MRSVASKGGAGPATQGATDPSMEGTRVFAYTATDASKDPTQVMSAFLEAEGGCGCHPCCCEHRGDASERPFGPPPLPVAQKGIEARAALRQELFGQVTALVRQLNAAHLAGSLTPGDLEMLHALKRWYSALQAERDAAKRKR
jgi:hypothetical protein